MAMIASLRHRPARAPSSSFTTTTTTTAAPTPSATLKTSAATTTALLHHQHNHNVHSPTTETSPANPTAPKTQITATKNDEQGDNDDSDQESNGDGDSDGPFIELDCHHLLQDMQDTLEDSFQKTNNAVTETWRSTKATANEKIREVEQQVTETWDASKAAFEGAKRLLRFEELPKEWQSNPYILTGYRFLSSKRQCLKSIFRLHNETCNIWTHMLGLLGLIALGLHIHTSVLGSSTTTTLYDHAVFLFFFVAASECLISSTLYHTFLCHSRLTVMRCAATFDYIGIGVLITASVMATLHYGFFCDTAERWTFGSFSLGMGIIGCIIPFYPKFDLPSFRYFRIFIFLGMACSGIIPLTYAGFNKGWLNTWTFIAPFCKSGIAYLTGLVFYGHRFPEKQFPGWFDRWGHSHQLWHVAVVAGIYYHYLAMAHFFEARYTFGCLAVYGGYEHPHS